jgi:hypothetical protein
MIEIILFIIIIVLFSLALFIFLRNDKTLLFSLMYADASFEVIENFLKSIHDDQELAERNQEYEELKKMHNQILYKHSYSEILFSFKPFKLESWFTPEEVEFIKRGIK